MSDLEATPLVMWVIYDHPRDTPEFAFVARRWEVRSSGATATDEAIGSPMLSHLRRYLGVWLHLTCLPRSDTDDPVVVESWV